MLPYQKNLIDKVIYNELSQRISPFYESLIYVESSFLFLTAGKNAFVRGNTVLFFARANFIKAFY